MDFDFYDDDVIGLWRHSPPHLSGPWDRFVGQARAYVATGRLDTEEVDYKLATGVKLAEAREAVLSGADGWVDLVKRGISGNLVFSISQAKLRGWIDESPNDALAALRELWARDDLDSTERISRFCRLFPRSAASGPGTRMAVISVLLMGVDAEQFPPVRVGVFDPAYQLTGYDGPEPDWDEAAIYGHALGFLGRFIEEAAARGLELRHRLDAQSVVWAIGRGNDFIDDGNSEGNGREPKPDLNPLARKLYLPASFLQDTALLLMDKKQRSSSRARPARARRMSPNNWPRSWPDPPTGLHWCNSTRPTPTRTSCRGTVPRCPDREKPGSPSETDRFSRPLIGRGMTRKPTITW